MKGADGAEESRAEEGTGASLFLGPHVHSAEVGKRKARSDCSVLMRQTWPKKAQF